jgi:hypothetical protein
MGSQNLIQAEFFLAGKDSDSLEQLEVEVIARLLDGVPIKTTVRFYDDCACITECIRPFEALREQEIDLIGRIQSKDKAPNLPRERRFRRFFGGVPPDAFDREYRGIAAQREAIKIRARSLVLARIRSLVRSREIAIERGDHSFRMVRGEELHELMERAERAHGLWLFAFQPNDLLADSNQLIASMM